MRQPPLTLWRWSRNKYEDLVRLGVFAGHPVELIAGRLVVAEEVHREPTPDSTAPHGWRYRSIETFGAPAVVAPLELPSARILVSTLLP